MKEPQANPEIRARTKAGLAPGVGIPPGTWHSVLALAPGTLTDEVRPGPCDPARSRDAAPGAPAQGARETPAYLARLRAAFASGPPPAPTRAGPGPGNHTAQRASEGRSPE